MIAGDNIQPLPLAEEHVLHPPLETPEDTDVNVSFIH